MSRSAEDYQQELTALQPPGRALPRERTSIWQRLLLALAAELARIEARALDILDEADPRSALELLPDWERVCGLPDPCTAGNTTIQERRRAVVQRLTARGGQSVAYFEALADRMGYNVTIKECRPFMCGISHVGVDHINPKEMRFVWFMRLTEPRATYFRVGSSQVGTDPLLKISRAEDLECMAQRLKPAQSRLFVSYTGA